MSGTELLTQCAERGTVILIAAFAGAWLLRRGPAAWRHFLWTAAMAALLVLPLAVRSAPKYGLLTPPPIERIAVSESQAPQEVLVESAPLPVPSRRPVPLPILLWIAGAAAAGAWFLYGRLRVWRMMAKGTDAVRALAEVPELDGAGVHVKQSPAAPTALTAGLWRPVVLLPADWQEWPGERLRAVLLHEFMHIERRDLLAQGISQVACCLFWFHPLAWMASRELRKEREQACDDAVLRYGIEPHRYAEHLVELVRALGKKRVEAMTMAERSGLETRVRALLDAGRNRQPLGRWAAVGIAACFVAALLTVSVVKAYATPRAWLTDTPVQAASEAMPEVQSAAAPAPATAAPAPVAAAPAKSVESAAAPVVAEPQGPGTITGVVEDPTGARVPGAKLTLVQGTNEVSATADPAGAFRFDWVTAGRYAVKVTSPGFKVLTVPVTVEAGVASAVRARLTLGSMTESVMVTALAPSATAPAGAQSGSGRIRVGGNVQSAMIIKKVPPVYPADLKAQGITGVVTIQAILTKEGRLRDLLVTNPDIDPGLAKAATDAVSQWVYRPALLNGEPVQILTSIDVSFSLQQ